MLECRISFCSMVELDSVVCVDHIFFIPSPTDAYLGGFCILDVVNNAAMDIGMQVSLQDPDFNSFGQISRKWDCWIAWQLYVQLAEEHPYCCYWLQHFAFLGKLFDWPKTYCFSWPGVVAHVSNLPALWEADAGGSLEFRSLRPAWPIWWNPVSTKIQKLARRGGACL